MSEQVLLLYLISNKELDSYINSAKQVKRKFEQAHLSEKRIRMLESDIQVLNNIKIISSSAKSSKKSNDLQAAEKQLIRVIRIHNILLENAQKIILEVT